MGISAECNECGATLDVSFSVDCDGDGSATVERCDCQDDRMRTDAVDNFMEDGFWDALNTIISEDASQFIEDNADLSECVQNTIDEAIEEKTEELAKEVISNIVGKYTMVPKGEPLVKKIDDTYVVDMGETKEGITLTSGSGGKHLASLMKTAKEE